MRGILAVPLRHNVFANILTFLVLVAGVLGVMSMAREIFPEMSVDMVLVTVAYPGADPTEVETGVAQKLEEALEGQEGIKNFYTYADEGGGAAVIECAGNVEVATLKEEVRDRVDRILDFPADVEDVSVSEIKATGEVLNLALYGDVSERDLKEMAEDIKDELVLLPEISKASVSGVRNYEMSIEVDEERLRQYGLTLSQVSRAVRALSMDMPGGTVKTAREEITVRAVGRRYNSDEFGRLVVLAAPNGTQITLDRVATIHDGFTEDPVLGSFNGKRSAQISVFKTSEEDSIAIAGAVDRYMAKKELPAGMALAKWRDTSRMVQSRIDLLTSNGIIGFVLVFAVLWLFLDLRLGFWVSLGIPISLGGAMAVMAYLGATLNMLSMFALIMVLGIVVDDAIVVGEAIYHHRRNGLPPLKAAYKGVTEVALPVIAAVFTTIVAFTPLLFVSGIMGKFISIVPLAVIAALTASLFECLFLLPAHLNHLPDLTRESAVARLPFLGAFVRLRRRVSLGMEAFSEKVYAPLVGFLVRWRYPLFASAITVMLVALGMFTGKVVKFTFFPESDADFATVRIEFPRGTPIDVTEKAMERVRAAMIEAEEAYGGQGEVVVSANTIVGSTRGMEPAFGSHLAQMDIETVSSEARHFPLSDFMALWREKVGVIPGIVHLDIKTMAPGHAGNPVEVWLLGHDMDRLRAASKALREHLATQRGVYGIQEDYRPGKKEVRFSLKPEARALGLDFQTVAAQVRSAYWGAESLRVQRGRENIRVYVRYPLEDRATLDSLRSMRIVTPAGQRIALETVADFEMAQGYSRIVRKNGKRRIVVSANVDEALGNAKEIMQALRAGFLVDLEKNFPGVTVSSVEGQEKEMQTSMQSLMVGFSLAALGIFLILATIFRSYLQPLVIITTVPFGFAGVVFAHWLLGYNMTMMSLFGLVALMGVVVNDAIVLIEAINSCIARGMGFEKAIRAGGRRRFRAVVLTTLTTFFGLTPLILEQSFQAQMLIPMAIAIAFGVGFATLLTLFLLPCELAMLNDARRLVFWVFEGRWPSPEEVEPARRRSVRGSGASAENTPPSGEPPMTEKILATTDVGGA